MASVKCDDCGYEAVVDNDARRLHGWCLAILHEKSGFESRVWTPTFSDVTVLGTDARLLCWSCARAKRSTKTK